MTLCCDVFQRQSQLLNLLLHLCIEELDQGDLTDFRYAFVYSFKN